MYARDAGRQDHFPVPDCAAPWRPEIKMRRLATAIGAALVLTLSIAPGNGGGVAAQEATLAPHRAAYVLSLGTAKTGGIVAIDGAMTVDWQESCEGWTMSQRMRFRVSDADGDTVDNDVSFSSWESRDSDSYRFTMRTLNDGETIEELRGRATLAGRGKGGRATFTEPAEEVIELPPGTLFPTLHTLLLIDEARAGRRSWSRPVFDGATIDGAMEVNAVIGATLDPGAAEPGPGIAAQLLAAPSWRVRLAFFRIDDQTGSEPEYETEFRLYANGVGTDFVFDYAEFSIRGRLERLEALPRPRC
jgi:hypothetical protein